MAEWNSFSTDSPLGISSEVITYPAGNGDQIHAYVARPTHRGGAPHAWLG
jgi:carboxymethylenebutenolidase